MEFLTMFLIALVLNVVSYLLAPKPKQPKPEAAKDMDNPTADAGREIPMVWGTITVKSMNCLWFGEKSNRSYTVKA